jgi:hypothetical protein
MKKLSFIIFFMLTGSAIAEDTIYEADSSAAAGTGYVTEAL